MTYPVTEAVDGAFDVARRRMLAYAGLAEYLGGAPRPPGLDAQVLSHLRDDIEAIAVYLELADGALTLLSHAGFAAAPPAQPPAARKAPGARHPLARGALRPAWAGARAATMVAVPFGGTEPDARRGCVLFLLPATEHGPSLAALLELSARRIVRALLEAPAAAAEPVAPAPDPISVLLIDDDALMVAHVRRILGRAGFVFHAAQRARAGLDLALAIRPDVILMDKVMPDMDGTALLRLMRTHELLSTVPVIMLSGQSDEPARIAALGEGADDFILKPFSAKDLVARIDANVRLVRLRREAVWRQGEVLRLRQSELELRHRMQTAQDVRDDERRMLAREVHDQLGQMLTVAKLDIRVLQERLDQPGWATSPARTRAELDGALASIDLAIASVQNIARLLRPPALKEGGLVGALRWQAADMQRRGRIACTVLHDPAGYTEPPPFVAGELLRICQEALTNVLRHADATRVTLQVVVRNADLLLRVHDNGIGIARRSRHAPDAIGLRGMAERAAGIGARIRIQGRARSGTLVSIRRRLVFD